MTTMSLSALFTKALSAASKAYRLPTEEAQDCIRSALSDLDAISKGIDALSLFSPNESLEDISTRDLIYLLVPYVSGEVQGRVITPERDERMVSLHTSQRHLRIFLSHLENYDVVPEAERSLFETKASSIINFGERRELKIKQYKMEKELRTKVQELRKRRRQVSTEDLTTDLDLIISCLPPSADSSADIEDDADTEEILRNATVLLLRLTYTQAHSQLESMDQELELLRTMPSPTSPFAHLSVDDRTEKSKEPENLWKLDPPVSPAHKGQLLDANGKPRSPITIISSRDANRARLQAGVFGPGHSLPTMSIDEYLEIERQRGNIITGGGAQSATELTSSEQLALDAEMEGTVLGEAKAEEKRLKDESWARFTDVNPKGQGNSMNRG